MCPQKAFQWPESLIVECFKTEHPRGNQEREVSGGTCHLSPTPRILSLDSGARTETVRAGRKSPPRRLLAAAASVSTPWEAGEEGGLGERLFIPGLPDIRASACAASPSILKRVQHSENKPGPKRHPRSVWPR